MKIVLTTNDLILALREFLDRSGYELEDAVKNKEIDAHFNFSIDTQGGVQEVSVTGFKIKS